MADNTAKIILTIAADGALRAAESVKKKMGEIGQEGGKAGDKLLVGLGRSLLTAGALIKVAKGIAEAFNQAAENAANISKTFGGKQLEGEIAAQRLGLSSRQTSAVFNAPGVSSQESRTSLLNSLRDTELPGKRKVNASQVLQAQQLLGGGLFSQDEIIDALKAGGGRGLQRLQDQSGKRRTSLSVNALAEIETRTSEQAAQQRISETDRAAGERERKRLAKDEALRAENPNAFLFTDAVSAAGGAPFVEAGRRAFGEDIPSAVRGDISPAVTAPPAAPKQAVHVDDAPTIKPLQLILQALQKGNVQTRPRLNQSANGP